MAFWRADQGIGTDLRDILARVEKLEPVWKTEQNECADGRYADELESGKITPHTALRFQQWLLEDTKQWRILMTFVQSTPDGELTTCVYSSSDFAAVNVTLQHVGSLKALLYWKNEHVNRHMFGVPHGEHKVNRVAVEHVREWVRRRVLPELETAKVQRDAARQDHVALLEAMRKKYLP